MKAGDKHTIAVEPVVQIRNLQRTARLKLDLLQRFAERALAVCHRKYGRASAAKKMPYEIFVLLISDRRMASLHKRFLNQRGPTDVITFRHGEIFISVPTARRQAKRFGTSLIGEIQLYVVHGLLHLHGFNDVTTAERQRMRAAEATVMRHAVI